LICGGGVTVTVHLSVFPPAAAVIVAVPIAFAVTIPLALTVATPVLLLDHVTVLSVAFEGLTVADIVKLLPIPVIVFDVGSSVILVTEIVFTITKTELLFPPAVAVMITGPPDLAVTIPLALTVATLVLPLDHVTVLFVALDGVIVGVIFKVLPTYIVLLSGLNEILVTGTVFTITKVELLLPLPSAALAVMMTGPPDLPVTTPLELTVATLVLLLDQTSVLLVALAGVIVAVILTLSPTFIVL